MQGTQPFRSELSQRLFLELIQRSPPNKLELSANKLEYQVQYLRTLAKPYVLLHMVDDRSGLAVPSPPSPNDFEVRRISSELNFQTSELIQRPNKLESRRISSNLVE